MAKKKRYSPEHFDSFMEKEKFAKCKKCRTDVEGGGLYLVGGEFYAFCKGCDAILKSFGTNHVVNLFLEDKLEISPIDKAMIQARKDRADRKRLWKKPD